MRPRTFPDHSNDDEFRNHWSRIQVRHPCGLPEIIGVDLAGIKARGVKSQ